jgi:hypothetical protein
MGETLREPQGIDKAGLGWRACEDNGKESNKEIFHYKLETLFKLFILFAEILAGFDASAQLSTGTSLRDTFRHGSMRHSASFFPAR